MSHQAQALDVAEHRLPAGHHALHRCRAAAGHLLELPAATSAHVQAEKSALEQRQAEHLKLARYVGTISSLAVFFFAAFLLKDVRSPFGIIAGLLLGATQLPLAMRVHRQRNQRELAKLEESFEPLSAGDRVDLANIAQRWPETIAALKRWLNEGRPLTDHELRAVRRFDYHRGGLEDELRATDALARATDPPYAADSESRSGPHHAPPSVNLHFHREVGTVIGSANEVKLIRSAGEPPDKGAC